MGKRKSAELLPGNMPEDFRSHPEHIRTESEEGQRRISVSIIPVGNLDDLKHVADGGYTRSGKWDGDDNGAALDA